MRPPNHVAERDDSRTNLRINRWCDSRRRSSLSANTIMHHRAFAIDEILREVTARVTRIHPPTAVALACCAKSFEEPALSALWMTQDELLTLIKTLPPDSWAIQPADADAVEEIIVRGLSYTPHCSRITS